jgi:hypothetical protein
MAANPLLRNLRQIRLGFDTVAGYVTVRVAGAAVGRILQWVSSPQPKFVEAHPCLTLEKGLNQGVGNQWSKTLAYHPATEYVVL